MTVARYLDLQHQKAELRGERDHLVLEMAVRLGRARMAEVLGIGQQALAKLLEGARERLDAAELGVSSPAGAEITVRRLRERQRAGLTAAPAENRMNEEQRPARKRAMRSTQAARSASPPRLRRRTSAAEQAHDRWALADAHYEALGRTLGGR